LPNQDYCKIVLFTLRAII